MGHDSINPTPAAKRHDLIIIRCAGVRRISPARAVQNYVPIYTNTSLHKFGVYMQDSLETRFWENVDKKSDDECWEWQGSISTKDMGYLYLNKKQISAHKLSAFIHNLIPSLDHKETIWRTCHHPSCVNPKHLFIGTAREYAKQGHNYKCRIDSSKLDAIFDAFFTRSATKYQLAKQYKVSLRTIESAIKRSLP